MSDGPTLRRLAAILAIDVVGYSRLMGRDETGTLARLKAHRSDVVGPKVAEHRGRIANLVGDAVICEFGSVVDAVACALEIQAAMATREADRDDDDRMRFRIGINLGDIVVDGDEIFGDGINVAARIEGLAEPGGICLSASAREQLSGKIEAMFNDLGEHRLKNIDRPVRVYGLGGKSVRPPLPTGDERPCVAVLPFDDLSSETDQRWFSDGLTEDLITELSRFRELLVIARNSSFAFRGKASDVRELGRALGATHVVEGSVRRAGERLRITAQLIDAATGAHLWAERYDRPLADVFVVQEEIATGVASTVALRVIDARTTTARTRPAHELRAYDFLLQARSLSDTLTPEAQAKAAQFYRAALDLDPHLAHAWTGLAYNHFLRWLLESFGKGIDRDADRDEALRLAEHAVTLDRDDARVQQTFAFMSLQHRMFDQASRHADLARALNPNEPSVQLIWAWIRACVGDADNGLTGLAIAFRLNPRHPDWYDNYKARIHFLARRPDVTETILEAKLRAKPLENPRDLGWLVAAIGLRNDTAEASRWAPLLLQALDAHWRGDPEADAATRVRWLVASYPLARAEDVAYLCDGLRAAGVAL